jgi:uncharacterized phage protein gp47/JayE
MQLSLQNFTTLVQGMAATVQASAEQMLDLTVGSTLRAMLEASASVALWMQWLILQVLQMTRAATSSGSDLDSWMADFSLSRLPSVAASGLVTFSRYSPAATALVPIGALVRTIDGSQTFSVVAEANMPGWNESLSGYFVGVGVNTLDIPVVAQTPGSGGNVQAGSLTVLATAISGIDSASNAAAFQNGVDAESDGAFRLRFQTFIASLSRATAGSIENAIVSVQQGLSYTIQENANSAGQFQLGEFAVYLDDGSGYPSNILLQAVRQAVDIVRPIGSTFAVLAPNVLQVSVSLTLTISSGSAFAGIAPSIVSAITTYIDAIPLGVGLPASRIVQVAYSASTDVVNVTQVLLNGTAADIAGQACQVIKSGLIVVN